MPIFNDYANGKPLKEIADELNSQGFRTVNGKMFNMRNLRQILKDDNAGYPVDYALVWDQPHSEADYPGEILEWIDSFSFN